MRRQLHSSASVALLAALALGRGAHASGLQPIGTSEPVSVEHVSYSVGVRGMYASGVMEVVFRADSGEENSANYRFPLPPGGVVHRAEIYLPAQDRWEAAETCGRREGEIIYEDITEQDQTVDPLLVQQIDVDLYRARVYPIDAAGSLRIRIHYAHVLERTVGGAALRIAFASLDSVPATPAGGVNVQVTLEPNTWNGGTWYDLNDPAWIKDFDGGNGCATLQYDQVFTMDRDLVLNLSKPGGCPRAGALHYVPSDSAIEEHVHAWWEPDLSAWPGASGGPRSVVFVIDRSGSMYGSKIEETKKAVNVCLGQLETGDYFGVVAFDTTVQRYGAVMRPSSSAQSAASWVSSLYASGGTNILLGLEEGAAVGATTPLPGASIDLLLITDAMANVGTTTSGGILQRLTELSAFYGRRIRVFGCGMGYDLVQSFVNELAAATGAEATFALDDGEITGQITELFSRIKAGGVSDVSTSIDFPGALPDGPYTYPCVFPGRMLEFGARGPLGDDCTLSFSGVCVDGTPVATDIAVAPDACADGFEVVAPALAARTWADRLESEADLLGEAPDLVDEAVVLAKTYGIVTRYSSLLALESEDLYVQYGVECPLRDEAGIALEPVSPSSTAEMRVGGAGTWDTLGPAGGSYYFTGGGAGGASCAAPAGKPRAEGGALALALAVALVLVRSSRSRGGVPRRGRGDGATGDPSRDRGTPP